MNTAFRILLDLTLLAVHDVLLAQETPKPQPPPANYVAHEWGTFTSMAGTDGLVLDGLHREEEALPKFVHDLLKIDAFATTDCKMPASCVTQKMETPVVYFYSDEPLRVQARVWFSKGLMTQFYPLPSTVYPELAAARKQRVDMSKVDGSMLEWDVDLVPRAAGAPAEVPAVAADDPWAFARQTGSCFVRSRPRAGSPARVEAEHYLFYRGLGRWQANVTIRPESSGVATLRNGMEQEIPFCALLELGERGGRFAIGEPIAAGASQRFDLANAPWIADRERLSRQLGAAVMQGLVQQGLFLDEARAMVATWSRSWFQKDGARAIYVLPRKQVDAVLPLSFEPRPKELVRVLIGRLEFITPETQQQVEGALRDRATGDAAAKQRAEAVLAALDRFLEPHLRNVERNGSDASLRRAAAQLLAKQN
ncbi:MAG TPA: hypothetical protein VF384_15760 [Planctomycetota bacterium]